VKRRQFITLLGGAPAWPLAARAQQAGNAARIGVVPLGSASNTHDASLVEAFRAGKRQVGLDETSIDLLWVKNEDEYAQGIGDLLQRGVRVLITAGTSASLAAKQQTSTIPIVFVAVGGRKRQSTASGIKTGPSAKECSVLRNRPRSITAC
jgi:putative ABC transport system substrate-binding protein